MNIFKMGLVLLTGLGFGFGVDQIAETKEDEVISEDYYIYNMPCHGNGYVFEHMLDTLTEEDRILVEAKLEELLLEYETTLELLEDDYQLRFIIMNELLDYMSENNIDFNHYNTDDDDGFRHHHMR